MHDFILGSIGGVLIGLAASMLYFMLGRVLGVSGIVSNAVFSRPSKDQVWRWLFLVGIPIGVLLAHTTLGIEVSKQVHENLLLTCIAGFLVGFGVKLGSGCTSGHGICGLARFSPRSLVATLCFMAMAIIVVSIWRHLVK